MREKPRLALDAEQRAELYKWVHGQCVERRLHFRAAIIWQLFEEGATEQQAADTLQTTLKTARKWRDRFSLRVDSGFTTCTVRALPAHLMSVSDAK